VRHALHATQHHDATDHTHPTFTAATNGHRPSDVYPVFDFDRGVREPGVDRLPLRRPRDVLFRGVEVTESLRSVDRPRRRFRLVTGVPTACGSSTGFSGTRAGNVAGDCDVDCIGCTAASFCWVTSYTSLWCTNECTIDTANRNRMPPMNMPHN
jgi:hypothetical protein